MRDTRNIILEVDGIEVLAIKVPITNVVCTMMHLRPWARRNFRLKEIKIKIGLTPIEKSLNNETGIRKMKDMYFSGRTANQIASHFKLTRRFVIDILEIKVD